MIGASVDPYASTRQALAERDMTYPGDIVIGRLQRCSAPGKGPRNGSGWFVVHEHGVVIGSWVDGSSEFVPFDRDQTMTPSELAAIRRKAAKAEANRRAEQAVTHREAAHRAADLWSNSRLANNVHAYLQRKQVCSHGLHVDGTNILISVSDLSGRIQSIQTIGVDGKKLFMRGGKVAGGVYRIGEFTPGSTCIICEGFATAATIHEQSGHCVLAAFTAKNLKPVAQAIRQRYPSIDLVIAADNDRFTNGNPGVMAATDAARATGAKLLIPEFPEGATGTDFNDLANWYKSLEVTL